MPGIATDALLAELARATAAVAAQVDADRTAAIRAAIEHDAAVEDETGKDGRFWFVRDTPAADPAYCWLDRDGDAFTLGELPYALVVAADQSAPAWRETLAERLTASRVEAAG
jgi:hypothetical protein